MNGKAEKLEHFEMICLFCYCFVISFEYEKLGKRRKVVFVVVMCLCGGHFGVVFASLGKLACKACKVWGVCGEFFDNLLAVL